MNFLWTVEIREDICYHKGKYNLPEVRDMELGQKLRQARLEAGITQRQLCGEEITRNMLSQIENGGARPSMQTLQYLARQLGKPVSWFLEEDGAVSGNLQVMESARQAYSQKDWEKCRELLRSYREPDSLLDQESCLMRQEVLLNLAEQAAAEGKKPYALSLLAEAEEAERLCLYSTHKRRRLLLQLRLQPEKQAEYISQLPGLDEELLLRAEAARISGDLCRSQALLNAMENRETPRWAVAMAEVLFACKEYAAAAKLYLTAEEALPEQTVPRLEQCFEALEDYKLAYHYARKQRQG